MSLFQLPLRSTDGKNLGSSSTSPSQRIKYLSWLVPIASGLQFSWWYSLQQLNVISVELPTVYPLTARLESAASVLAAVLLFYLFAQITVRAFSSNRPDIKAEMLVALSFAPLLIAGSIIPLQFAALMGMPFLLAAILRASWISPRSHKAVLTENIVVLALLGIVIGVLHGFVSPLNWSDPIDAAAGLLQQEQPAIMPVYQSYAWSKLFSFSTFNYSYWGMAPNIPTHYQSYPLSIISLLSNAPSIAPESFHRLFHLVLLTLMIGGAFSTYILLRESARMSIGVAFGAALAFALGNVYATANMLEEPHLMASAYAVFPFVLLMLDRAFRTGQVSSALWAGAALAAQFYLLAPHPEATIYSALHLFLFGGIWLVAGVRLYPKTTFRRLLGLSVLAGVTFLILSSGHFAPIFGAQHNQTMYVFGHFSKPSIDLWLSYWEAKPIIFSDVTAWFRLSDLFLLSAISLAFSMKRAWRPGIWQPLLLGATAVAIYSLVLHHPYTAELALRALRSVGFALNMVAPKRNLIWFYFSYIIIIAYGVDAIIYWGKAFARRHTLYSATGPSNNRITNSFWVALQQIVACALVIVATQTRPVADGSAIYNANQCNFFISLQATLANYPGLSKDTANATYIRDRLITFEQTSARQNNPEAISALSDYRIALAKLGAKNTQDLTLEQAVSLARTMATRIDDLALAETSCINPLSLGPSPVKRIVRYNVDALYRDIGSPHMRIMAATRGADTSRWMYWDAHLGIGNGLLNHTAMTSVDSRFMMAPPLLHALYLIPDYDYSDRGYYRGYLPWALTADKLLAPSARPLMDIAGGDVFTVLSGDRPRDPQAKDLLDITPKLHPRLDPGFSVLLNKRSYGLAYVANGIEQVSDKIVRSAEETTINYFHNKVSRDTYVKSVNRLRTRLQTLPYRHAAILEPLSPETDISVEHRDTPPGTATVLGMVGPRAALSVACNQPSCFTVFNMAALPGWSAYVDNLEVPIYRANFGFMAVKVPQGDHIIWFYYTPLTAQFFFWITLLGYIGILCYSYAPCASFKALRFPRPSGKFSS